MPLKKCTKFELCLLPTTLPYYLFFVKTTFNYNLFFFFFFVFFFYLINLHHYYTCRWWLLTSLVDWIHTSLKFFVRIGIGVGALTMQSQTIQFTTFAEKEICSIAVGSSSQARTLIQWKSWKHDLELKSCSLLGVVKEMCCFTEHSASFPCRLSPHSSEKKRSI